MDAETLKKYRLCSSKVVTDQSWQTKWKAKELLGWLQGFLDKHGIEDADVSIDIDNWYETSVNGLLVMADVNKTEDELLTEIKHIEDRETAKRKAARERAKENREQEKQLYNELHAKYGPKEKKKTPKSR